MRPGFHPNRSNSHQKLITNRLSEVFRTEQYPNLQVRNELASELSMTERSVQIWFQNRRATMSRMEKGEKRIFKKRKMREFEAEAESKVVKKTQLPVLFPSAPPTRLPPPEINTEEATSFLPPSLVSHVVMPESAHSVLFSSLSHSGASYRGTASPSTTFTHPSPSHPIAPSLAPSSEYLFPYHFNPRQLPGSYFPTPSPPTTHPSPTWSGYQSQTELIGNYFHSFPLQGDSPRREEMYPSTMVPSDLSYVNGLWYTRRW